MLKKKRNWRNYRIFCHIFVIDEISIGKGADPLPSSPWLRLCSKWGKQKKCSQIFHKISGAFQRNFNCLKNSAVLEPRTGQFSRTWGFEAKAKDLTFEAKAKAKDFKMCPRGRPRGQGRPRGLHLWLLALQPTFFKVRTNRQCQRKAEEWGLQPSATKKRIKWAHSRSFGSSSFMSLGKLIVKKCKCLTWETCWVS